MRLRLVPRDTPPAGRINQAEAIRGLLRVLSGCVTYRDAGTDIAYAEQALQACMSSTAGWGEEGLSVRTALEGLLDAIAGRTGEPAAIAYADRVLKHLER